MTIIAVIQDRLWHSLVFGNNTQPMESQNGALQTLIWTQIIQGSCSYTDFESVDLGWSLRFCISKKFSSRDNAAGL